jgi:hypothetical protein
VPTVQHILGAAGTIRQSGLNRLRFQRAQRVLYRYITPNKLEVLGSSAQMLSNGLLRYPKTNEDATPWMNQLKNILTHNGFPPNSTCYTDGSFKQSKGSMWQYINSTTIPSENWKEKPILIIHISQGHELEGDSVYPMELLALICALRMAKFLDHPHSIVTDSQ